jgi:hypothetical protein
MSKTVVIVQSNYLPWRGYFDLLRSADEAILLESVQYTRSHWRNRNLIKTAAGPKWLTIAVQRTGHLRALDETLIADPDWSERHIRAIEAAYRGAPHYRSIMPWLSALLRSVADESLLTHVNERLLRALCERLEIDVPLRRCSNILDRELVRSQKQTERLVALAKAVGADCYLSGPRAKDLLDLDQLASAGIVVAWMNYDGYPEYSQLWGGFEPRVSVIDLLFNTGPEARRYLAKTPNREPSG